MNRITTLVQAIICVIALVSCSNSTPAPLQWECTGYDPQYITVEFTPTFYIQAIITAKADFAGEIILTCTNYTEVYTAKDSFDPSTTPETDPGFSISKANDNQLKISFRTVENADAGATIEILGKNKDDNNFCILSINRCR